MARRRGRTRTHGILEWVYDFENIATAPSATVMNEVIDLDLMPDEVAEIWNIDTSIRPSLLLETDITIVAGMTLSMDPGSIQSPLNDALIAADVEIFYEHLARWQVGLTTSGIYAEQLVDRKKWCASPEPILVGTNIGMASNYTESTPLTGGTVTFTTRVYFTRRRASIMELNQVLLKKR